jgi:hypothetical protein
MKTGDIILFKPSSLLGEFIAGVTDSKYSHSAVVFDVLFGKVILFEIDWTKSRLVTLSSFKRDYDVYGIKGFEEKEEAFKKNILISNYLNKGYDYIQLFTSAQKILFKAESIVNVSDKYLCSEIVDRSVFDVGIDLVLDKKNGNAVPEDLARSKKTYLKKEVRQNG